MIGRPESDVRHVSHVGYDGTVFGDVSLYGNISDKLPLKTSKGRRKLNVLNLLHMMASVQNVRYRFKFEVDRSVQWKPF